MEAAELLAPAAVRDTGSALLRAGVLVEQCMFAYVGWDEAAHALDEAARLIKGAEAGRGEERGDDWGVLECERATFAIAQARAAGSEAPERARAAGARARAAVERAGEAFAADAPGRGRLEFIRGALLEAADPTGAAAAYETARVSLQKSGEDDLVLSYVYRHIGGLTVASGAPERAREHLEVALDLRERIGFAVGMAPVLAALAEVSAEPDAALLRSQAVCLIRALGGLPVWLRHLNDVPANSPHRHNGSG
jgi:hypothetical protein